MEKINKKYNSFYRDTHRLKGFDYSTCGYYFITICTRDMELYFGEIIDDKMILSEMGMITSICWINIVNHFPFVDLDEFIIMPNHIHGIIQIKSTVATQDFASEIRNSKTTQDFASLHFRHNNKFGSQSKNLSSIIRGFKIGVKKYAVKNNIDFYWQPRFYDHIIRNKNELNRIRQYIINNPANWERDRNIID